MMPDDLNDRRNAGRSLVTVDGLGIAVEVLGNGSPTVMTIAWIHGLGGSAISAFGDVIWRPALAGTTSVLIDLPGHGASDWADACPYSLEAHATIVNRVLEAVGARHVTLVGHSMGGAIAILCAASASRRVERLILAEPSLDPGAGRLSAHIAAQTESWFVERGYAALVRATQQAAAAGEDGAQAFLPSLQLASPVALHRSATSLLKVRSPTFRQQLRVLPLPKSLLVGDRSSPFEPLRLDAEIQGYVVRDAGHQVMADNPDGFAAAVAAAMELR